MAEPRPADAKHPTGEFAAQAERAQVGLVREVSSFLLHNKKWWLAPIIVALLLVALVIIIGGSAGPFIYTLF